MCETEGTKITVTGVAAEKIKEAQNKELLESASLSLSPKLKKIACYKKTRATKQTIERFESGLTEQKMPKKQRVKIK